MHIVQSLSYDCSPLLCQSCNWSKAEQCNIANYRILIASSLPCFPQDLVQCCVPNYSKHIESLDSFTHQFIKCIIDFASCSIPGHSRLPECTLAGWKQKQIRSQANFWHKVWLEAGCPATEVLFQIKKQ